MICQIVCDETLTFFSPQDAAGRFQMKEVLNSEEFFPADLVLLSMGFLGPDPGLTKGMGFDLDPRGNFKADYGKFNTTEKGIFACGDCRRGQSLVYEKNKKSKD